MIWLTCRAQLLVPTAENEICLPSAVARGGTHTQPPTPIHLGRPPMSRLWASTAAEPRRIFTARRLEMWPRRFAWLHLDFSCRCAAQLLRMEFAVGAMPSLRRSEPAGAGPLLMLTSFGYASSISHFRWATIFLDLLAL